MTSNYCHNCEKEVARCWDEDGMCAGGGHCMECYCYFFEDDLADEVTTFEDDGDDKMGHPEE